MNYAIWHDLYDWILWSITWSSSCDEYVIQFLAEVEIALHIVMLGSLFVVYDASVLGLWQNK